MTPQAKVILSCVLCWAPLCLAFGITGRSWTDLLAVGIIITLNMVILARWLPRFTVAAAYCLNGGILAIFLTSVVATAWSQRRGGDG